MSKGQEITAAVEEVFRQQTFDAAGSPLRQTQNGSYILDWKSESLTVKAELLKEDSIGVLLNLLIIEKDIPAEKDTPSDLKRIAETIVQRINYLMEPLKVVELDETTRAVQMRSEKPEISQGNVSYYEVLLKSGKWFGHREHVSLRRYSHRTDDEPGRKQIAFALTKQQFQRLIDDLIDIL